MEVPSIFLNRILSDIAKRGASCLHLSVGSSPIARINGRLVHIEDTNIITVETLKKIIDSFTSKEELEILEKEREIVIVKKFGGNFRFRINIFYQKDLPSLSFNYIHDFIRNLDNLKIPELIKKTINLNSGLLVVAGPNDSGKTSTVAAFIEELNKNEEKYIITIESPIEYVFINNRSVIEQRQVGRDVLSYVDGLEHCLEEDVDLVYVDTIKKEFEQAMPYIFELASGNSFVILEVDAASSVRVIEKILNAAKVKISEEAARFNLADILVGIIVQNLIPSRGGGMSLALETLAVNSAVKSLIREGKIYQLESIIQTSREEGMISMKKSIQDLVKEGKIPQEEVGKMELEF
ncbi:MAG: ATPase, T2SS/T4P/T4SS family [Patescibacteria group bacterium]